MIQVFKHPHPEDDTIRIVFDDGEGGIYELRSTALELIDVDGVDRDWIELTP